MKRRSLTLAIPAMLGWGVVAGQERSYPTRTIKIISSHPTASAPDVLTRAIAREVTRITGQPVVVEVRPGAGTLLAVQAAANVPADGYTVLMTGISAFAANRHLFKTLPYDPVNDFRPVTALAKGVSVLYASPKTVPATTMTELIQLAKARPGALTIGDATATTRVLSEMLQRSGGFTLKRIPYRSSTQALPDLISGRVDLLFTDLTAMRFARDGLLRAIGVADSVRTPLIPELPTLKEAGLPDLDIGFIAEALVPSGTPANIVERLRKLFWAAMEAPEVKAVCADNGMQPMVTTSDELHALHESEAVRWGKFVKELKIEPM